MELRLPPVPVFFVFSLLMYLLANFLPFGNIEFVGRLYLILFSLFLGIVIIIIALGKFLKIKTTVDPLKPTSATKLVTSGIYAYTRNPMYLAILLMLIAFAIKMGNVFNALLIVGYVGYMNRFQIIPEERALFQIFGKDFKQYCLKVRRWV